MVAVGVALLLCFSNPIVTLYCATVLLECSAVYEQKLRLACQEKCFANIDKAEAATEMVLNVVAKHLDKNR